MKGDNVTVSHLWKAHIYVIHRSFQTYTVFCNILFVPYANAGGSSYVDKEIQRLSGLIGGSNIKPESKTSFQLRQNVLKAFRV